VCVFIKFYRSQIANDQLREKLFNYRRRKESIVGHKLLKNRLINCLVSKIGGYIMLLYIHSEEKQFMAIVKFKKTVPIEPVTKEIVRPELNIEKMQIWQPAKAKKKLDEIVIERPNRDGLAAKVTITANSKYGALTTETQKVLYALYQISEEQGHPRRFYFSRQKIARILKKPLGVRTQAIIDKCLKQLRFTAFVLENSFFDITKKSIITPEDTITILSVLKTVKETTDGHITKEACYAEFNEYIYNNLINNHTKPLLFETLLTLGDDGISQIFYTHLDVVLSSEKRPMGVYSRRSEKLFEELNFTGKEYKKVNYRKVVLEKVKDKLNDKPLSKGGFLKIDVEKTKDRQDYLLIADDVEQPSSKLHDQPPQEDTKPAGQPKAEATGTPVELVQYFHKKFFKLEEVEAQPSELKQATDLMKKYGFEIARFVVDYAFKEAEKTNFQIAVFGGILGYTGRAKAKWKKDQEYLEKSRKAEERDKAITACKLGCWKNNGKVFWTKPSDEEPMIANMDCLHDEAKHREEEQRLNIKIAMNREALKS
jgi:hypothetical protein